MYLIAPDPVKLTQALAGWKWIGIEGMTPIVTTAFACVFFRADNGIWFLDTLEGTLSRVCSTEADLNALLATQKGKDDYLSAGLVDRAVREGMTLKDGECYDYRINPILGGSVEFENVQKQDFVVALHVAGQIYEQVRHLTPGTKISAIHVEGPNVHRSKPWWKFW
jgi:hypothetical protein